MLPSVFCLGWSARMLPLFHCVSGYRPPWTCAIMPLFSSSPHLSGPHGAPARIEGRLTHLIFSPDTCHLQTDGSSAYLRGRWFRVHGLIVGGGGEACKEGKRRFSREASCVKREALRPRVASLGASASSFAPPPCCMHGWRISRLGMPEAGLVKRDVIAGPARV